MKLFLSAGLSLVVALTLSSIPTSHGFAPPQCRHAARKPLAMSSNNSNDMFGSFTKQLGDMFAPKEASSPKEEAEPQLPDVVIDPDYKLAAIFSALALVLDTIPYIQIVLGIPTTLLAILFVVQTSRIRFVFTSDSFELKQGQELEETGENIVVGGANKWTYDSFVNYDFFPKGWIDQPQGPILVYFKETQTPQENWNDGPGAKANSEQALAAGAKPGQVHFFPALCNTKQLQQEFEKRNCAKL